MTNQAGQLELDASRDQPARHVEALAGVIAGFLYPGRSSFTALTKREQEDARRRARLALYHDEGGDA